MLAFRSVSVLFDPFRFVLMLYLVPGLYVVIKNLT
jgi:hypothetical protein